MDRRNGTADLVPVRNQPGRDDDRALRPTYRQPARPNARLAKRGIDRSFAEARDPSEHTVRKLKAFAMAYELRELDDLLTPRRPNGLPLHWGCVVYLLATGNMTTIPQPADPGESYTMAKVVLRMGFGRRTALVCGCVVGGVLIAYVLIPILQANRALREIRAVGGDYEVSYARWPKWMPERLAFGVSALFRDVPIVYLRGTRVDDKWLRHLSALPGVVDVELDGTLVTDRGLCVLGEFRQLRCLSLSSTAVTSTGLEQLRRCGDLRVLNLSCTAVDDQAMAVIASLKSLKHLDLSYTMVTDEGVKNLSGLDHLYELLLDGTALTDVGLKCLSTHKELRVLGISSTRVTLAGLGALNGHPVTTVLVGGTGVQLREVQRVLSGPVVLDISDPCLLPPYSYLYKHFLRGSYRTDRRNSSSSNLPDATGH